MGKNALSCAFKTTPKVKSRTTFFTDRPALIYAFFCNRRTFDEKSAFFAKIVRAYNIFNYFQTEKDFSKRTDFIKKAYQDVWTEVLADDVRVGYHKQEDGLLMWEGSYLSRTSESVFSWGVVTEMTER